MKPTGSTIENLSAEKRAALLALIEKRKKKGEGAANDHIKMLPRKDGENDFVLSFAQSRLWFMDQMEPGSIMYNEPYAYSIKGSLNIGMLQKALNELVKRHEILRTRFQVIEGEPRQVVVPEWKTEIEIDDLSGLPRSLKEKEALETARRFAVVPFDLSKLPLVRFKLICLDETEFIFVAVIHHIISDGWSMSIFFKELSDIYNAFCEGRMHNLRDLPFQYADYSQWQVSWFDGEVKEKQVGYWKRKLGDDIPVTEFPEDKQRPRILTSNGDQVDFILGPEITGKLRQYALKHNSTLNMVTLAAFKFLIHRYVNQSKILVGLPVANRNVHKTEDLIGLFVNTVVLCTEITEDMMFTELLYKVRETVLEAFENQDMPFEKMMEEFNITRDTSRSVLVQIIFNYMNVPKSNPELGSAKVYDYQLGARTAVTEFLLNMEEDGDELKCRIEYNSDIYCRSTIERIAGQYERILCQISENYDLRLNEISILSDSEKDLVLYRFNDTYADCPKDKTMVELFEEQVEKTPDNTAVVFGEKKLSYSELNARANALAVKLRSFGVGPDDFVAILAERSIEMIEGILGVIKSGGAYVPIDPGYPRERVRYMLEDCKPKAILTYVTEAEIEAEIKTGTDIPVIDLGDKEIWEDGVPNPVHVNRPEDLVYVIYTSGTTGRPKGVMIENIGIASLRECFIKSHEITSNDRVLQFSSFSFDAMVAELVMSLLAGAALYIVPPDVQKDARLFERFVEQNGITAGILPPQFLSQLKLRGIKAIMSAGSEANHKIASEYSRTSKYLNGYGPTEATVCATYWVCEDSDDMPVRIPIGKPVENKKIYILKGMTLCGIGMPGEICIAGVGLARGYLNKPELTAEKFVDNSFGEGKMYRTGDLGRWLPDGNIEFLGRIDEQVKIRGYRIELGEIESVLRNIGYIKDAAVVAREDRSGEKAIHAYLVSDAEICIDEVREILKKDLPEYMIPAYMMQIEKIPVTRNGKLDRNALPEITAKSGREYIAPGNETEELVCRIYSEILGTERVSIKDNFFELGGHSLRAARVLNRIETETGVRIPFKVFFAENTPEKLSQWILAAGETKYETIPKAENRKAYPMSSTQKRIYLINQMEDHGTVYNIPQCYFVRGDVDAEALRNALIKMMERHEILRTRFGIQNGEPVQIIEEEAEADFVYEESNEETSAILKDFVRPFDLTKPVLIRMKLVKRPDGHLLLLDMHHIVADGMSIGIFMDEFSRLYNGESLEVPRLQYRDYSEWMRKRDLKDQKAYWISEFNEEVPLLDLPYDFKRPQVQSYKGAVIEKEISDEIRSKILELASATGTTEYMILLSGLMVLLGKYSGQEDIVVGTPVSGRTHRDTENMIGMFVNTLAMRGRPEAGKTFYSFLDEIRETTLKAYENQEYPFEELVENIVVRRDFSRNPLFDVMLVLQNNEDSSFRMDGLDLEWAGSDDTVAKFDLTFNIIPHGNRYHIRLEYCTDLFMQATVMRMLENYVHILYQAACGPYKTIGETEAVTDKERTLVCIGFNDTYADYPKDKTVVDLFEKQAEMTPDNTAVVFEDEQLTYSQLNARANALAVKLRGLGVGPDDFVAILAERSIEMITGILGVIKSGGAYVPIDPGYPRDRIRYMLEDCKPKAILTYMVKTETELGTETDIPVIDLRDKEIWKDGVPNPVHVSKPEDLLYVIYTSGTTGRPKGVMIENSGVINLREYFIRNHGMSCSDRVLQFSSFSFDAMVSEIAMSLLTGAALYIVPADVQKDAGLFEQFVERNGITAAILPPQFLSQVRLRGVRTVISAGSESNHKIASENSRTAMYSNDYGPTEVTVCATHWLCKNIDDIPARIPIGKPIENKKIYILNGRALCGIGMPGEICIAGVGLARGYLNKPELTAEKFINNPFGEGKLYRSGDLGRWLPDGNIEFLGRIDDQVKIRGFRIELGEIESVIRRIGFIKDVAVIAREDKSGEKAIHAYLVSDTGIRVSEVREIIKKDLPEYMIPAYMMQIEKIPVTRNGKLDRNALPEITAKSENEYVAPRTKTEESICRIYSEILGTEKVSVKDNFFELGGHSLSAIRLVNLIEAETGIRIPIKDVFSNPTAEKLAGLVNSDRVCSHIQKAEEKKYYPMSSTQKRTYIINQLEGHGTAYNMPHCFRLTGKVNVDKLREALQKMHERHEILRTSFLMVDEVPVQKIEEYVRAAFDYFEDYYTPEEELIGDFIRPFDLGRPPLVRMRVVKRKDCMLLLLDMHHIISDGISMAIFFDEFSTLYNGSVPEPPSLQYKDFSEWMHARDISSQKQYWLSEFREKAPVLDLPYDFSRPGERDFKGAAVLGSLPDGITKKIKKFVSETGTTEYMVLLSAFMVLLSKYSGQEDIVVGSPISGRTHKDTESMLGMFVNTIAVRGRPEPDKTFIDFLKEIRESLLKAYENQDYPFEELVEALGIKRDMSRNPLFDVMFVLNKKGNGGISLKGAEAEEVLVSNAISKFDVTLTVEAGENEYGVLLEYCTSLFTEETARRMIAHFSAVLESILENPGAKISELDILTSEEKEIILKKFNDTCQMYPEIKTVHHLFEEQVRKTPNDVAVCFEDESYTYQELNKRANQLAAYLVELGVGPETRVGLFIDRSLDIMVGIFGILKAGGAYVPIDPMYPRDRVESILNEARVSVVLTHSMLEENIPALDGVKYVNISSEWETIKKYSDENPVVSVGRDNLMYIIFTSGSTGKPKGVMVEHGNYLNYLMGIIQKLKITVPMSFAIVSTFAADLGSTNVYVPLTTGGHVHIISYERAADPEKFADYFRRHKIDAMKIVPSHFEALQVIEDPEVIIPGKLLIFAGESCAWETVRKVRKLKPGCAVYNNYGPTETTVSMLCYETEQSDLDRAQGTVPLGRPIGNVKTYVLDKNKKPVPVGVPGELYIGGAGVARGYLDNPELTSERFVDNPFDPNGKGRLYRTGDLVKYLPDGNICILGRIDRQVKIRGYRVEPEEIEEIIKKNEGVHNAVVAVKEDKTGDKRLVAYIVCDKGSDVVPDVGELRKELRSRLPDYMVPSVFMEIDSIPLNPNGKADLDRLPEISETSSLSDNTFVAPRNDLEKRLAQIWSDVLGIDRIGIDDDFYDLGGDSFKTIRAVRRMDPSLSVIDFIKRPTIRELAGYLSKEDRQTTSGILCELTRPVKGKKILNLICVPYGGGNAISYKPLADMMPEGFSLYTLQLPGHDFRSRDRELKPLEVVAEECLKEIREKVEGPVAIYGQCVGGALAIKLAMLLEEENFEVVGVFQAAVFPQARLPGRFFELWNRIFPADKFISDKEYKEMLRSIGGGDEAADREEQAYLLKGMRHDAREFLDFFTEMLNYKKDFKKLKAPICCIVGDRDRTTEFYEERYQEWLHFSDQVDLKTIEGAGHFFHKHQPAELKEIILNQLKEWSNRESDPNMGFDRVPEDIEEKNVSSGQSSLRKNPVPSLKILFIVCIGQIISLFGSALSSFGMGIWVYNNSKRVSDVALVTVFSMIPGIILAPFAGVVADRYDRRKVMLVSDFISAIGVSMIAFILWRSQIQIWHICIAVALSSAASTFQWPAFMSAITQIVPKCYLGQANGLVQLGMSASTIIAPIVGGAITVMIGLPGLVLIDMITFIASVLTLSMVVFPNRLFAKREESFAKELSGGWRYIIKRKSMVALVIFFAIVNLFASAVSILVNPLLLSFIKDEKIGVVVAAESAGLLIGSLIMSIWGGTKRRADGMIGFVIVAGMSYFLLGIRPSVILAMVALFGMGLSVAFVNTHWQVLIQTKVGLELQGRVFSVNRMLAALLGPLAAVAGPLADNVFEPMLREEGALYNSIGTIIGTGEGRGIGLMLVAMGLLLVVWGILGMRYKPLRHIEAILPDAVPGAVILRDKDKLQELADLEIARSATGAEKLPIGGFTEKL